MTSKFYQKIAIALLVFAVVMTVYGVYFLMNYPLSAEYKQCKESAAETCAQPVLQYVMFTLGSWAFAGLAFFHAGDRRKQEERDVLDK